MCSGKLPQVCIALVSTVYVSLTKTTLFKTEDGKGPVVLPTALLREAGGQLHKKKWVWKLHPLSLQFPQGYKSHAWITSWKCQSNDLRNECRYAFFILNYEQWNWNIIVDGESEIKYVILLICIQLDSESFYGCNGFEMQLPKTLILAYVGWHWWVKVFIFP